MQVLRRQVCALNACSRVGKVLFFKNPCHVIKINPTPQGTVNQLLSFY